jgi:hypothetical protein
MGGHGVKEFVHFFTGPPVRFGNSSSIDCLFEQALDLDLNFHAPCLRFGSQPGFYFTLGESTSARANNPLPSPT